MATFRFWLTTGLAQRYRCRFRRRWQWKCHKEQRSPDVWRTGLRGRRNFNTV